MHNESVADFILNIQQKRIKSELIENKWFNQNLFYKKQKKKFIIFGSNFIRTIDESLPSFWIIHLIWNKQKRYTGLKCTG